jgi:hypothetical protein
MNKWYKDGVDYFNYNMKVQQLARDIKAPTWEDILNTNPACLIANKEFHIELNRVINELQERDRIC